LIQGIGCIIIFANEPAKLANWYSNVLGIKTSYDEAENLYHGVLVNLTTGARVEFGIRQSHVALASEHHAVVINYYVDDLESAIDRIRSQQVHVEAATVQGSGRFTHMSDPEGNVIQLWEPIEAHGARA
jgi:predicted enzyme related to lactoylglutathione lyase